MGCSWVAGNLLILEFFVVVVNVSHRPWLVLLAVRVEDLIDKPPVSVIGDEGPFKTIYSSDIHLHLGVNIAAMAGNHVSEVEGASFGGVCNCISHL